MATESLVIVTLNTEEVWRRNERLKNWGNYKPYLFRRGQPRILVAGHLQVIAITILMTLSLLKVLYSDASILLRIAMAAIYAWGEFCLVSLQSDPGIESSSLPVVNRDQIKSDPLFCDSCSIMRDSNTSHCDKCKVCMRGRLHHSWLLDRCITRENYPRFLNVFSMMLLQTVLMLVILHQ